MNLYVQYHNVDNEGLLLSSPPFSETRHSIRTRLPAVLHAEGRVFLIAGLGRPRRYFLWETFEIEHVRQGNNGAFRASGTGWQLSPPVELKGNRFEAFKTSCANFVGFRSVTDLPYARTLCKLAEAGRPSGTPKDIVSFLDTIKGMLGRDDKGRIAVLKALGHYRPELALSIRQPHAEAIMRGVKTVEYRLAPTNVRGRVRIYASLGRDPSIREEEMMTKYRIRDTVCDDLPRGVLIGSVELHDCDGGDWHLRKPERAKTLLRPKRQPQPVWFYPF